MIRRFARPYAKAILDIAGGAEKAATVVIELRRFEEARAGARDLQEVFANPGIELDAKVKIGEAIAARLQMSDLGKKVIDVLIRNQRINDLGPIVMALQAAVHEATNTVVAEVRSAHRLSEQEAAALRATLEKRMGKRVAVQVTTDPGLIGGFIARIGSEIYDASVAGKIEKFRESLA